jgi:hypothetical protein
MYFYREPVNDYMAAEYTNTAAVMTR